MPGFFVEHIVGDQEVLLGYFCGTHREVGAVEGFLRDTEDISEGYIMQL